MSCSTGPVSHSIRGLPRLALLATLAAGLAAAQEPRLLDLQGDTQGVHDPVIIREKGAWYVFSTNGRPGRLIPVRCSPDLLTWKECGAVFEKLPAWALQEIPGVRAPWAPDISFFQGRYLLYYSLSTFGRRDSAIGLAANATLDPARPDNRWVDQGMVVRSRSGQDDWNAIDPNLVQDGKRLWLAWGSFWSGIKMRELDPATGKLHPRRSRLYALAARPRTPEIQGSVEAPFLVRRGRYWYLFSSFDFCCRGAKSTYRVVAGRSRRITGPYLDREGRPLLEGGGAPVLEGGALWKGPGHPAVFQHAGQDFIAFHAYHHETGRPFLHLSTLVWEDGWPRGAKLP